MNLVPGDTNVATDIFEVYLNRDMITSVSAPALNPGDTGDTITISGRGFQPNAVVLIGPGITVTSTTVTPTRITVQVDVAGSAAPGTDNVEVVNLGTGPGPEAGAAAIYPGGVTVG